MNYDAIVVVNGDNGPSEYFSIFQKGHDHFLGYKLVHENVDSIFQLPNERRTFRKVLERAQHDPSQFVKKHFVTDSLRYATDSFVKDSVTGLLIIRQHDPTKWVLQDSSMISELILHREFRLSQAVYGDLKALIKKIQMEQSFIREPCLDGSEIHIVSFYEAFSGSITNCNERGSELSTELLDVLDHVIGRSH